MKFASVILGAALLLSVAPAAMADVSFFNDCQSTFTADPNVTHYGPSGGLTGSVSGQLVDYATGAPSGITVTEVWTAVGGIGGSGPAVEFTAGTDAYNTFNGKVANIGTVTYYGSGAWSADLTFTNLMPGKTYQLVTTVDRGRTSPAPAGGYPDRWTKISILDADSYTNASSNNWTTTSGGFIINNDATSLQCDNAIAGAVAKWIAINPGSDNDFTIHFTNAVAANGEIPTGAAQNSNRGYAPTGFMLVEVPEPATMSLLVLGGLALIRRTRR